MDPRIPKQLTRMRYDLERRYGVTRMGCFDCYIDHHHNRLCDINVYVELEKPLGWKLFELKEYLEQKLELHIDIITPRGIKPALKEEIMSAIQFV
ncbi:MAG: nucleotidyltransferase family protein [Flavobacteriales bacterium]|jgi:predicted nucleotidyltransferase